MKFNPRTLRLSDCASGKVTFDTRSKAKRFAKAMASRFAKPHHQYHCRLCGAWHISSKPRRRYFRLETMPA